MRRKLPTITEMRARPPRIRRLALAAFGVAATLAAIPASAAPRPTMETVTRSQQIVPGQPVELVNTCPERFVAVSGGVVEPGRRLRQVSSLPRGRDRWAFNLFVEPGDPARMVTVVTRCAGLARERGVRPRPPRVRTVRSKPLSIFRFRSGAASVRCPRGYVPTGYGQMQRSGSQGKPDGGAPLTTALPTRRGFRFVVESPEGSTNATLYGRCLQKASRATRRVKGSRQRVRHTFRITRRVSTRPVRIEEVDETRSCRRNERSLGVGYAIPTFDQIFLSESHVEGERGGRWKLSGNEGVAKPVQLALACMSTRSTFKPIKRRKRGD